MTAMIVTVTLNPAIDQTLVLDHMEVGEANRVLESRMDPGGKGINVSRVLRELGTGSVAAGFAAGGLGRFIEHELERQGILVDFVHTPGETRTNLTLVDPGRHVTTTVHDRGPLTDERYVQMLRARIRKYLRPGIWLVIAGSIPPPLPPRIYADLIAEANESGVFTVLDADGDGLRYGVDAHPTLLKVNQSELEHYAGRPLDTEEAIIDVAVAIQRSGVRWVLVTRSQHPGIAVDERGVWRVTPPYVDDVQVQSTVGAGDAALAGTVQVLAGGGPFEQAVARGMACGTACTLTPGTMLCQAADVARLESTGRVEHIRPFTPARA